MHGLVEVRRGEVGGGGHEACIINWRVDDVGPGPRARTLTRRLHPRFSLVEHVVKGAAQPQDNCTEQRTKHAGLTMQKCT